MLITALSLSKIKPPKLHDWGSESVIDSMYPPVYLQPSYLIRNESKRYKMGLIGRFLGKKPKEKKLKYKSMKKLGIHPDWVRGKIYQGLVKGMTPETIYETMKNDEFGTQNKNDAIRYIEYLHKRMIG